MEFFFDCGIITHDLCLKTRTEKCSRGIDGRHVIKFKGGPEPLENEINKILGSQREDRFSDHFSDLVQNICSVRFSYLLRLLIRLNRFLKIEKIEIDLIDLNRFKSI